MARDGVPMRLSRHPGLVFLACIALFVAGGGTVLYGFGTLAYDVPVAETVIAFAAGVALVGLSVTLAIATERQLRRTEAEQVAASSSPAAVSKPRQKRGRPAVQPDRVLGTWTLARDEWRAFNQQEAALRRRSAVEYTLIGAAMGAAAPWIFTGHWRYSLVAAPVVALAVLIGTLVSAARLRAREPRAGGGVVVRRNAVEVDGETTVLRDGTWYLSAARVRDDLPLPVLELSVKRTTYERNGSRRTQEQVVRVPVPRGRAAQAASIAEQLGRGLPDEDEDG